MILFDVRRPSAERQAYAKSRRRIERLPSSPFERSPHPPERFLAIEGKLQKMIFEASVIGAGLCDQLLSLCFG